MLIGALQSVYARFTPFDFGYVHVFRPTDGSDHEPDVCIIELGGTVGDIESTMA